MVNETAWEILPTRRTVQDLAPATSFAAITRYLPLIQGVPEKKYTKLVGHVINFEAFVLGL